MFQTSARRRARVTASAAVAMGLFAGTAALVATPAQSAEPAGDCTEAFPVADVVDGAPVTGLTVSEGTTPEGFTGEILGVIEDGIAPGLDMVMAELSSAEIDRVGIWQGMSGSPVYAEDGRLIGAVAYGLSWGPSPVAGITPFEAMDDYLPDAPAAKVKVDQATAREIARGSDVTANQAEGGFSQLRMPLGVSGISNERMQQARELQKDRKLRYLPKNTYAMGAASQGVAGPETIVAGGNLAVALSYGDITQGGVGTATSICDGGVVGFGHPAAFYGKTTMTLHPADALFIQEESLGAPFKVANLGAPAGTITDDRRSGVSGMFGALPATMDVTSTVTYLDRSRTGSSHVSVPEANPWTTFLQQVVNHDTVLDDWYFAGSELQTWTVAGDDNGTPYSFEFTDRYASDYDLTYTSPWDVADIVWYLSSLEGVTVQDVTVDSAVNDDSSTWQVRGVEQLRDGEWVKVSRRKAAVAKAGKALKLRALLESTGDATSTVPLSLDVPTKAKGKRGGLEVIGGSWIWSYRQINSVDDVADMVADMVRNDAVKAQLDLEGRSIITKSDVSDATDKVVFGRKFIRVKVR